MSEAELLAEVIKLCEHLGLLYHHCTTSTRCRGRRGFPDLVIAGPGGFRVIELKSDDGELSADQDLWRWTLAEACVPVLVFRPDGLADDTLRRVLDELTRSKI